MRERIAVQLSLRWGAVVLRTTRLCPPRAFALGTGGDWTLPEEALGGSRRELLRSRAGEVALVTAEGAASPLRRGMRACVELGALAVDVEVGEAEEAPAPRLALAPGALGYQAVSATLHGLLLATFAMLPPRSERIEWEEIRALVEQMADWDDGAGAPGSAAGGSPVVAEESEPAAVESPAAAPPAAGAASPHATREPTLGRSASLAEASTFGVIGLLDTTATPGGAATSWGRAVADAGVPAMWGDGIDDVSGGGLGLSGIGEGGGGRGEGIGIGEIGHGAGGCGGCQGSGQGIGRIGGGHAVRAPRLRGGDEVSISGRLPPEVILRIVRANEGRFRLCYERGLAGSPGLRGRITTRFVIARDGSVAVAAAVGAESDLPDEAVVQCVVRAFGALSFPEPAGGMVTVEYPYVFDKDGD